MRCHRQGAPEEITRDNLLVGTRPDFLLPTTVCYDGLAVAVWHPDTKSCGGIQEGSFTVACM